MTVPEDSLIVGSGRAVPVFSVRDAKGRETAARMLAEGKIAAFYGGLFGIVKGVGPAWTPHDEAEAYWRLKPGRPSWSKVPLLIRPRDALRLIDFRGVHPRFRHFAKREAFEHLYKSHGAPLHVIAPLREPVGFLDRAFQTRQEDVQEKESRARTGQRAVSCTTASFFWMADSAWESFSGLVSLYSRRRTFYGVSSFNAHGEQPPYTFDELVEYVRPRNDCEFDLVIHDQLFESSGAFSSHTQVRLPLDGEPAELVMVRQGGIGPAWLAMSTGYRVRVTAETTTASRCPGLTDEDLEAGLRRLVAWQSDPRRNSVG